MNRLSVCLLIITLIIIEFSATGCGPRSTCPKRPSAGNLGPTFNSNADDRQPQLYQDTIFFLRDDFKQVAINKASIQDLENTEVLTDTTLPFNTLKKYGTPSFAFNTQTGSRELLVAALSDDKKANRDIYYSTEIKGKWIEPIPVKINTEGYESHPFISPDGGYMIFSSDRTGSTGSIDLWLSVRQPDMSWGQPKNLRTLNTEGNDIAPFVNQDGTMLFCSDGYLKYSNLDIIKAQRGGQYSWYNPKPFPLPINSMWDEIGAVIHNQKIIFSSNRGNGCGSYDLYAMDFCMPVELEGRIYSSADPIDPRGELEIFDAISREKIVQIEIGETGGFHYELSPNRHYVIEYRNRCIRAYSYEYDFYAPCSDSTPVRLLLDMDISPRAGSFTFDNYSIPFFVTGYYKPNTSRNLENLKMKFAYNLLGNSDSTAYIENPGNKYDLHTEAIDSAFAKASRTLLQQLAMIASTCSDPGKKLMVSVIGYTDSRPISKGCKYSGDDIVAPSLGIDIKRGAPVDNPLLSQLRAWYTAREIIFHVQNDPLFMEYSDMVEWEIVGGGIYKGNSKSLDLNRRIEIKMEVINPALK